MILPLLKSTRESWGAPFSGTQKAAAKSEDFAEVCDRAELY
jgi:hypothetical protein